MTPRDPHQMGKAALIEEVVRLRHLLKRHMQTGDTLWMESGVNLEGDPFVQLRWGDQGGQLTSEEARRHALDVLETAVAADHDSLVFRMLTRQMELEPEKAAAFIGALREERGGERAASEERGRE